MMRVGGPFSPKENWVYVVRCKDCKYWDNMPVPTKIRGGTYCIKSSELMDADDFCSKGERRGKEI